MWQDMPLNPSTEEVEARLLMEFQASQVLHSEMLPKKGGMAVGEGAWQVKLVQWQGKEERTPGQTTLCGELQDTQGYIPRPPCLKTLKRKKGILQFKSHAFKT